MHAVGIGVKKDMRILMVGLDAAGKTTILYKLKVCRGMERRDGEKKGEGEGFNGWKSMEKDGEGWRRMGERRKWLDGDG